MNTAAEQLYRYTDFTSFSKLHTDVKTNNCRVTFARWEPEGERQVFTITADRFLRNMVRAIVGTLLDVGRGKLSVEDFCHIIETKTVVPLELRSPAKRSFFTTSFTPTTFSYPVNHPLTSCGNQTHHTKQGRLS